MREGVRESERERECVEIKVGLPVSVAVEVALTEAVAVPPVCVARGEAEALGMYEVCALSEGASTAVPVRALPCVRVSVAGAEGKGEREALAEGEEESVASAGVGVAKAVGECVGGAESLAVGVAVREGRGWAMD